MKKIIALAALTSTLLGFVLFSSSANATPVTALADGTLVSLPAVNAFTGGPVTVSPDITWSSNNTSSVYGYNSGYGFGSNGVWNGLTMVGSNSPTAIMTFTFANAVQGFGGFLNYAPGSGSPAVISTFDVNHNLIESTILSFQTGGATNSGQFHGFLDSVADIASFQMTGSYIGGTNFVVQAAAVPEPLTLALLGIGLFGMMSVRRRKQ